MVAEYPREFYEIAEKAAARHPDNIDDAVNVAEDEIWSLPDVQEYVKAMVRAEIRSLIHEVRHRENVAMRRAAGEYGKPAKVTAGEVVNKVAKTAYDYSIAGRSLGSILGGELLSIRESELQHANGSLYNVALCDELRPLVKEDKAVRDCVPERKLRKMIDRIKSGGAYKVDGTAVKCMAPSGTVPKSSTNGRTKDALSPKVHVSGRKTQPEPKALAGD